ncbi:hypothetical protein L9F63_001017, partial [Diploptera punctata]
TKHRPQPFTTGTNQTLGQEPSFCSKVTDTVSSFAKKEASEMCSTDFVKKRLPITKWLPQYKIRFFFDDMMAGLTVALTLIPQAIAYADVAGLQPQYGLYSAFMSSFVYILLGSCKDITIGPTAIMAIMTQPSVVESGSPDLAVLLCFLAGCIIVLVGMLRLGFLVEFISVPVTAGFISAAAITIASSQVKSLLGIGGQGNEFIESWENIFKNIGNTEVGDLVLGLCTIVVLLIGQKLKDYDGSRLNPSETTRLRRYVGKLCWIISVSRNAIVVVIGMLIAYILENQEIPCLGTVEKGFPPFDLPPFETVKGNETIYFDGMAEILGTSLFSVPFISILDTIAIAKSFSKGKAVDATQELLALGMCNVMSSFVRSMPLTASFSRTAVNSATGVKTPLGGLMTGAVVLLALGLLTSTFAYIPKATLAGVIITAVMFMVEYEMVPLLWRTKKLDLIPLAVTFFACLGVGLDYGMLIGIGVNLLFVLYGSARPKVEVRDLTIESQEIMHLTIGHGLVFPAAEYMRDQIFACCLMAERNALIVVDGSHVQNVDATVAKNLKLLVDDIEIRKQKLVFWNWKHSIELVCRGMSPKMSKYFHYEEDLESLLRELEAEDDENDASKTESMVSTQHTSTSSVPNV